MPVSSSDGLVSSSDGLDSSDTGIRRRMKEKRRDPLTRCSGCGREVNLFIRVFIFDAPSAPEPSPGLQPSRDGSAAADVVRKKEGFRAPLPAPTTTLPPNP